MTIEHQQYGRPCSCDIAEVTEREAQFLELMDDWYGDKSDRCHPEWLEILRSITDADMSAVQDSGIDKHVLLTALEDNEPEWAAGDDESAGWYAATRFIRENF